MKTLIKHSILFLTILTSICALSQEKGSKGYRIEGDDIVFSFDKRDYTTVTSETKQKRLDFEDFNVESVIVSGQFNNWSRNNWRMFKINENQYELRKKIIDFSDEFTWEFKFLVNGEYWAEPNNNIANITPANDKYGDPLHVYNLKLYTAHPDNNGNACFKLNGYNESKKVILAGSFNKWNEDLFNMNKVEDGWELTLQIKPGEYQYRFIVDGKWIMDPNNSNIVENEFGEYNSVLDIKKATSFILYDNLNAKSVVLSGTFNNWSETELKMTKIDIGWTYTLYLSGGKHHYKFIVDDNWIVDPDNPVKEYDEYGNINSVKMVK